MDVLPAGVAQQWHQCLKRSSVFACGAYPQRMRQPGQRPELTKQIQTQYRQDLLQGAKQEQDSQQLVFKLGQSSPAARAALAREEEAAQLNRELRPRILAASSLADLQQIVAEHGHVLHYLNASLLVYRLGVLAMQAREHDWETAGPAVSAVQQQPSEAQHQQGQAQQVPPLPAGTQLVAALEAPVLALVLRVMPWYTAQHFAQTATGLASVGYGSRAFWSRFTTEAERKLLSFNFYQLGQLLAAVAAAGVVPTHNWLSKVEVQASKHWRDAGPVALASLLWAWGRLNYTPSKKMVDALKQRLSGMMGRGQLGAQQLVQVLYGMSRLTAHHPQPAWLDRWCAQFEPHISKASPALLVDVLFCLVSLQHIPTPQWTDAVLGGIAARGLTQLVPSAPNQLAEQSQQQQQQQQQQVQATRQQREQLQKHDPPLVGQPSAEVPGASGPDPVVGQLLSPAGQRLPGYKSLRDLVGQASLTAEQEAQVLGSGKAENAGDGNDYADGDEREEEDDGVVEEEDDDDSDVSSGGSAAVQNKRSNASSGTSRGSLRSAGARSAASPQLSGPASWLADLEDDGDDDGGLALLDKGDDGEEEQSFLDLGTNSTASTQEPGQANAAALSSSTSPQSPAAGPPPSAGPPGAARAQALPPPSSSSSPGLDPGWLSASDPAFREGEPLLVPSLSLSASPLLTQAQFDAQQRAAPASRMVPGQLAGQQQQLTLTSAVAVQQQASSTGTTGASGGSDGSISDDATHLDRPHLPLGPMELAQLSWSLATARPLGLQSGPCGFEQAFCARVCQLASSMDGNVLADVLGGMHAVVTGLPLADSSTTTSSSSNSRSGVSLQVSQVEAGPGPGSGNHRIEGEQQLQQEEGGYAQAAAGALCSQLQRSLSSMQPDAISRALLGLVRLGHTPPDSLMEEVIRVTHPLLPRFTAQALPDLLVAAAQLGARPSQEWLQRVEEQLPRVLPSAPPSHVARTAWALAVLGHKMEAPNMHELLVAARASMRLMDDRDLVAVPWACAVLRHRPGSQWLQEVCEETERRLPTMGPQEMCDLVWSLALFSHTPPPDWMAALERALEDRAPSMTQHQVAVVLWALAQWRHLPVKNPGLITALAAAMAPAGGHQPGAPQGSMYQQQDQQQADRRSTGARGGSRGGRGVRAARRGGGHSSNV